ncbi:hypothetical protein LPJ73_001144 [Coemansia sp. RSA 2703]|nr:hypothetical protein LPJ73_001144 [Coemansia sp. RSA 2703]
MSPIQSLPLPSLASITSRSSSPPLSPPHKVHTSSQLIEESDAGIFYYSLKTDEFIKRPVDQIVGPNGKIYVEHIPNHNIITLPKDISLQKFGRRINRKTFLKLQSVEVAKDKPTKPLNVFIRYRSANLKRARKEHPTASQTDISRILAEQWRNEDPSVKEQYINNFLAENYQYNIKFKEWKLRTEQREFDRLDDYDPETPSSAISFGLTPFSSESQPTESMYTSSSAHAVDMTAYGGPSNFNPARRRSHSVPPQSSECQLPPLKRQRPYQ